MVLAAWVGITNELLTQSLEEGLERTEEEVALFIFKFLRGGWFTRRGRA